MTSDAQEPLRLLAVHAHPDDESSKGAATTARYVREGIEVLVVSCTGGERGDILNPALKDDAEMLADLPAARRREMENARDILGDKAHLARLRRLRASPRATRSRRCPMGCFAALPLEQVDASHSSGSSASSDPT